MFFCNRPASKVSQTREAWYFDYRAIAHHRLTEKSLRFDDLGEFIRLDNPANRHDRRATWFEATPEGRWRSYPRDELLARDKTSLDLFWLKNKALTDLDNLPEPEDLAEEIIDSPEASLGSLKAVMSVLRAGTA